MKALHKLAFRFRVPICLTGIAIFLFTLDITGMVDFQELGGIDLKFKLRGVQAANAEITVVTIDDASLAILGEWPWPRNIHGSFLEVISRYHPKKVFFDVLFTEAGTDPKNDEAFRTAVAAAGNVVLPFFYRDRPFVPTFPIESLKQASIGTGYVNVEPDADGKVRRVKLGIQKEGEAYFHPAAVMLYGKSAAEHVALDKSSWINYPGPAHSYRTISFAQAIQAAGTNQEDVMKEYFENRYVLIGHTAAGTVDLRSTPFAQLEPGIFIQAGVLHSALSKKMLRDFSWPVRLALILALMAGTLLLIRRQSPFRGLGLTLASAVAYAALNFLMFVFMDWILPLYLPLILILLTYAAWLLSQYVEALFQRERMEKELAIAAQIQEKFLPRPVPERDGYDAAFAFTFAKTVGGDILDWVDLDGGKFGFCIGDVSGKGVPAALFGAKCISDFRNIKKENLQPHEVLGALNRLLLADEISGVFLTFWYGVLDLKERKLHYASAGHEPCLHFQSKLKAAKTIGEGSGMPLSLFAEAEYETEVLDFEPGDAFLLFTDGIRELRNTAGAELGVPALSKIYTDLTLKNLPAQQTVQKLFETLREYHKGTQPHDDSTIFYVRC